jgi:hemoglobin-like flavoprotein
MLNISKYLEKIKQNINSGEILNNTIIEIIQKHTGVHLKPDDFELKNNLILLKTSPGVKNKIFISKNNITKGIENSSSLKNVDIR